MLLQPDHLCISLVLFYWAKYIFYSKNRQNKKVYIYELNSRQIWMKYHVVSISLLQHMKKTQDQQGEYPMLFCCDFLLFERNNCEE